MVTTSISALGVPAVAVQSSGNCLTHHSPPRRDDRWLARMEMIVGLPKNLNYKLTS